MMPPSPPAIKARRFDRTFEVGQCRGDAKPLVSSQSGTSTSGRFGWISALRTRRLREARLLTTSGIRSSRRMKGCEMVTTVAGGKD
jgi:hypothetical protein